MNQTFNKLFITTLLSVNAFFVNAQTSQVQIVNDFGDCVSAWCTSGDDSYREKIDRLVTGKMGCRVDDGIMKIFVAKDETGLLTPGSTLVDNYLNGFTRAIEEGLSYRHGTPVWQKDYVEPVAFNDKTEDPLFFVSMDVDTEGAFMYSGTNLFFVRGNQITRIEDFKDGNSLAKAIELYSAREYEEAFKLFRKLAYDDPTNYDAQYYTAVMEIKKQGCDFLASKVRDLEAAWWITRGLVGNSLKKEWSKERMAKLYVRFGVDEEPLPFNNVDRNFYISSLMTRQLVSEGLMVYKHKGRYGFMDERGKMVVPCQYDLAYPFDKAGHALVAKGGKVGYIDRSGNVIVPMRYLSGITQFMGGKTYVILGDALLLIDENGQVLKEVGRGYDGLSSVFMCGKAYAHHAPSNEYHVFDLDGILVGKEKESFSVDYQKCCYFIKGPAGERVCEQSFGWSAR